jgi:hypothetical protein
VDDNSVIALLESITDPPEPASRVDIAAARRRGRRRQRLWRAGAPALAVVAVVAAVTVPRLVLSGDTERTAASGIPTASAPPPARHPAMPRSAPATFNVLVPYAAFGWLPSGYSEAPDRSNLVGELNSAPTELDLYAGSADGGRIDLSVYAKGACLPPATDSSGKPVSAPADGSAQDCFAGATGVAPDVNGRPALWIEDGRAIAWEYAPDAWASVGAVAVRNAPATDKTRLRGDVAGKRTLPPVTAAQRNLVRRVAVAVKYEQKTPLLFSFKLTGPLPVGWQLQSVTFEDIGGRLLADGLNAGPAVDTSALGLSANTQFYACNYVDGQSSYVTQDGVNWEYRVLDDHIAKNVEMLCSTTKVDGLQVNIYLDMAPEEAGAAPLPGSTALGGAFGVYQKLRLLGPAPANWTTNPLA